MNTDKQIPQSPNEGQNEAASTLLQTLPTEQAELDAKRRELTRLEAMLEERETECNTLHLALDVFANVYRIHIGSRYAILDEVEAQIAELLASRAPMDKSARAHAERARKQARNTAEETGASVEDEPPPPPERVATFQPNERLKTLRRKLSKLAHPDLADNEQDRQKRTVFMQKVNQAFAAQDVDCLELLLDEWGTESNSHTSNRFESELSAVNRKIEIILNKLKALEQDIQQMLISELYIVKQQCETGERHGRNILAEMCAELDARISNARTYLTHLRQQTVDDSSEQ